MALLKAGKQVTLKKEQTLRELYREWLVVHVDNNSQGRPQKPAAKFMDPNASIRVGKERPRDCLPFQRLPFSVSIFVLSQIPYLCSNNWKAFRRGSGLAMLPWSKFHFLGSPGGSPDCVLNSCSSPGFSEDGFLLSMRFSGFVVN